ncbi:hypothetical protein DPMN_193520 [Dreissena polymorpha]|uniref:Uncharacterized protein n=1 Tax=Dreissena polymorpha TaxID=45954 RepID=A0A9D4BCN7_DREPO|nr:hypothetical protein DPMN_193520 [Dreissena polymorpha]
MLDSLSPTSVPSFMTIEQLLCLQQRQSGSHYKECKPLSSLWRFTRKRLTKPLANAFEYSREIWHVCSALRDPSNDAVLTVIGRHMAVPLTSEAATLTSSVTSVSSLGRPATWHVCRTHRDPPNDVGPVVTGRHMDVPLTS